VTRVAVVGHVEWGEFAVVDHVPRPGEIEHADETFSVVAGGGSVAAVQLRKLAGAATFFTALGDDVIGQRSRAELRALGVEAHAATREEETRRAFVFLDSDHERTITVFGERLVPFGSEALPWSELDNMDAVYFTGGDAEALRHTRRARAVVATSRALDVLREAGVEIDVLVMSANDAGEAYRDGSLTPAPRYVVRTHGAQGGAWTGSDGSSGTWVAAPIPAAPVDAYGCGDSFAAGLTYGMGARLGVAGALELASRCGAACLTGRGPYAGQLEERGPSDYE
jgi:ribokinase